MEFITLKTLTVGMLLGTAVSASAVPVDIQPTSASYEILGEVELKAEANIDVPAKAKETTQAKAIAVAKPIAVQVASKGPDSLDLWIDGLVQKESSGRTNIKILDVNNRYSYGCLQFQMPTFIAYGKRYGIISGSEENLESLIMSCNLQKRIAKKMILEDSSNWRHWYTSVAVKGLGIPPIN